MHSNRHSQTISFEVWIADPWPYLQIEAISVSKMAIYIYTKRRMKKWLILPEEYKISAQFIKFSHDLNKKYVLFGSYLLSTSF